MFWLERSLSLSLSLSTTSPHGKPKEMIWSKNLSLKPVTLFIPHAWNQRTLFHSSFFGCLATDNPTNPNAILRPCVLTTHNPPSFDFHTLDPHCINERFFNFI